MVRVLGNPVKYRDSEPNPIADVAEAESTGNIEDSVTLNYPGWHTWNFHENRWRLEPELVGSWGDRVQFINLPDSAKSSRTTITQGLGGAIVEESERLLEICSSPGEVANDPILGHKYKLQKWGDTDDEHDETLDQIHYNWHSNKMVWNTVVLKAADQLRHRVAWALASTFVATEEDVGLNDVVEPWAHYYDIFLRNTNYFDVLKEVSYR